MKNDKWKYTDNTFEEIKHIDENGFEIGMQENSKKY